MTEPYLSAVLNEAERIAKQHDQVARSTDDPAHEYLRYGVLRLLEGETDEMVADVPDIDGVTVGYGSDEAMYESWDGDVEWWETVPPQEECTCFRVFYPDEDDAVPRVIVDMMAALGAWRVWTGSAAACGSYDPQGRRALIAKQRAERIARTAGKKLDTLDNLLKRHADDRVIVFTANNDFAYEISREFILPCITHQTDTDERTEILDRSGAVSISC